MLKDFVAKGVEISIEGFGFLACTFHTLGFDGPFIGNDKTVCGKFCPLALYGQTEVNWRFPILVGTKPTDVNTDV